MEDGAGSQEISPKPPRKENPWEMTFKEFDLRSSENDKLLGPTFGADQTRPPKDIIYSNWIEDAFWKGIEIPREVLVEFPELEKIAKTKGPKIKDEGEIKQEYGIQSDDDLDQTISSLETKSGIGGFLFARVQAGEALPFHLAERVMQNPEEAQRIQNFAQLALRRKYGPDVKTVKLYRGTRRTPSSWTSMTANLKTAQFWKRQVEAKGKEGYVVCYEVPIENIFTFSEAHPAFERVGKTLKEEEYILNKKGTRGGRLISINGQPLTDENLKRFELRGKELYE